MTSFTNSSGCCRYVVATQNRSGTYLTIGALNSHPMIKCLGEMLHPIMAKQMPASTPFERLLARVWSHEAEPGVRAVGFTVHADQSVPGRPFAGFWEALPKMRDIRVIRLRRRNYLHHYASEQVAVRTGLWQDFKHQRTTRPRINLSPSIDELQQHFEMLYQRDRMVDMAVSGLPRLEVQYEELCDPLSIEWGRIHRFLGVDARPVTFNTKKQESRRMIELFLNYDQLKRGFQGTFHAKHFVE